MFIHCLLAGYFGISEGMISSCCWQVGGVRIRYKLFAFFQMKNLMGYYGAKLISAKMCPSDTEYSKHFSIFIWSDGLCLSFCSKTDLHGQLLIFHKVA